jgi:hypothetical protein
MKDIVYSQDITVGDMPVFEQAYQKAVKNNDTMFKFKNQDILTKYAKYLLEYFNNKV